MPAGNSSTVQGLTAFMMATSDPLDYGTPERLRDAARHLLDESGPGRLRDPTEREGCADHDPARPARIVGLVGQQPDGAPGSERALHPTALRHQHLEPAAPVALRDRRLNQHVGVESTLSGALADVLGGVNITPSKPGGGGGTNQSASYYLGQASNAYANAQKALLAGKLGVYQADVNAMKRALQQAQKVLTGTSGSTTTSSTTTTVKKS